MHENTARYGMNAGNRRDFQKNRNACINWEDPAHENVRKRSEAMIMPGSAAPNGSERIIFCEKRIL